MSKPLLQEWLQGLLNYAFNVCLRMTSRYASYFFKEIFQTYTRMQSKSTLEQLQKSIWNSALDHQRSVSIFSKQCFEYALTLPYKFFKICSISKTLSSLLNKFIRGAASRLFQTTASQLPQTYINNIKLSNHKYAFGSSFNSSLDLIKKQGNDLRLQAQILPQKVSLGQGLFCLRKRAKSHFRTSVNRSKIFLKRGFKIGLKNLSIWSRKGTEIWLPQRICTKKLGPQGIARKWT